MLLSNFKSSVNKVKIDGASQKKSYSFVFSNKHFFTGSHKSLTILGEKQFANHYKNLSAKQIISLDNFMKSLNQNGVKHISHAKRTKINQLNYVTVIFDLDGKSYTENIFTFTGFNKLVSYRGVAKYNLSLKGLQELAIKK